MNRITRIIVITIALAIGIFSFSYALEGGAPGREICVNCKSYMRPAYAAELFPSSPTDMKFTPLSSTLGIISWTQTSSANYYLVWVNGDPINYNDHALPGPYSVTALLKSGDTVALFEYNIHNGIVERQEYGPYTMSVMYVPAVQR
jgi:hypothetical protein